MAPSWCKKFMQSVCYLSEKFGKSREQKLSEKIHKAFEEYDFEKLSGLIESLGNPDALNKHGETPLYLASININGSSSERDGEMVKFLIERGANILHFSHDGSSTPAANIMQHEDQNLINLMLSKIEDVDSPLDKNENTALHLAVKKADKFTTLKLLRMGANPNKQNSKHQAPIHEAVSSKGCDLLRELVEYGGDINLMGDFNYTPLHLATRREIDISENTEETLAGTTDETRPGRILDKVLELHPYMNARDYSSNTALAIYLLWSPIVHEAVVNKYIAAGTDPSLRDQTGMNALLRLVQRNNCADPENLVGILLDRGVDIHAYTYFREDTALHIAAGLGYIDLVHFLLSKGANLCKRNVAGRTPIDLAIFAQKIEVIEVMFSFIVRNNVTIDNLMMNYHKTRDFYKCISAIHERAQLQFERMKNMRLYPDCRLFYSDVLFMSEKKLANLLRNDVISDNIEANLADLQAFKHSFEKIYRASKMKRDAEDAAIVFLHEVCKESLPLECLEIILGFMGIEELLINNTNSELSCPLNSD